MTPGTLAKQVSLSQATVTGIIDRLAARQLVDRERSTEDRRQVAVRVTSAGQALIATAPSPLQEEFARRLGELPRDMVELGNVLNLRFELEDHLISAVHDSHRTLVA